MDDLRFDTLARALGGANTRRGTLRLAIGGLLGGLGIAGADGALADRKGGAGKDKKASGKNGKRNAAAAQDESGPRAARGGKRGKGKGKRGQETLAAGQFQALVCSGVDECERAQPNLCYPDGNTSLPSKCVCQGNSCKVTICHATASESNPYTNPTVSFNAAGQLQGHEGHTDDIIPEPVGGCPEPCPSGVVCAGVCCPRGQHCSDGHCCPAGQEWNGQACIVVQCVTDRDCHVDSECLEPVCDAGRCGSAPKAANAACGTECLPGTCDGAGGCIQSPATDGTTCKTGGVCCSGTCDTGACCPGVEGICPAGQTCGETRTCGCAASCPSGQSQAADCSCSCPAICPTGQDQAADCSCSCPNGQTLCDSICVDRSSDADNCGACGAACADGQACQAGRCVSTCTPDCTGKTCGDDGCGGSCGTCPTGSICQSGSCVAPCTPDCAGKTCGDDGCGGSCGTCGDGLVCSNGTCAETCTPDCSGKTCGDDGCGGSCGACPAGSDCVAGTCTATCTPDCAGRTCGTDGCGGTCGTCPTGTACTVAGTCTTVPTPPCIPFCAVGTCGSDGCGGSCECPGTQVCDTTSFTCAATCTPDCTGRTCGTDGCGGSCGTCADGQFCDEAIGICEATPAICAPTGGNCMVIECCETTDTCLALDGVLTCQPTPPAPGNCAHAGERPTEGQRCCDRLHREGGICVINRWDHCDPRKRGKASLCENGTRCIGGRLSPHGTPVCVPSNKRRGRGAESAMVTPAP